MPISNRAPLYVKLADIIEENIINETWKKGAMIPSERELVKQYGMSRITVRKAIDELVLQGRLEKVQGKGTYVSGKKIIQNLGNLYSFSQEMERQGKISSTVLVERKVIKANLSIAGHLRINDGDEVIYIERLRCAEEVPILIEKTYFPFKDYQFLMSIDLNKSSLYKSLETEVNRKITRAVETFKATILTEKEADQLNSPKHQYGLLIKRTSFHNNELVCYSTIVSKGDTFEFTIQLEQ